VCHLPFQYALIDHENTLSQVFSSDSTHDPIGGGGAISVARLLRTTESESVARQPSQTHENGRSAVIEPTTVQNVGKRGSAGIWLILKAERKTEMWHTTGAPDRSKPQ
jgi:hypothetical protein